MRPWPADRFSWGRPVAGKAAPLKEPFDTWGGVWCHFVHFFVCFYKNWVVLLALPRFLFLGDLCLFFFNIRNTDTL